MNCYNHQSSAAVGLCKHCGKGLCAACTVDLGHGLACRGHEAEVEAVRAMVSSARNTQTTNHRTKYLSPLFFLVFGALFLAYGYFNPSRGTSLSMIMGTAFVAYSLILFAVVRRACIPPCAPD